MTRWILLATLCVALGACGDSSPKAPVAKAAASLSGRPVGECRRPVLPLTAEQMAAVAAAMAPLAPTVGTRDSVAVT